MFTKSQQRRIKLMLESDDTQNKTDPEWIATIGFEEPKIDDSMDNMEYEEISVLAPDFDTAVKYVEQYVRKMQLDETADSKWKDATILSVQLR